MRATWSSRSTTECREACALLTQGYKTATRAGVLSTTGASSNFVVAVETSRPPDGHGRTGIQTIGMDAWYWVLTYPIDGRGDAVYGTHACDVSLCDVSLSCVFCRLNINNMRGQRLHFLYVYRVWQRVW